MKKYPAILALAGCCIMLLSSCKAKPQETDLTSTHTSQAVQSMAPATTAKEPEATVPAATKEPTSSGAALNVTAKTEVYKSGNISIEYPVVENLSNSQTQSSINQHLKENALAAVKGYGVDEGKDSLSVTCKIISVDRKRLTAVYTGTLMSKKAAHPINVFYTNTIDMGLGTDLGFNNYSDAYTMAGYVVSKDCQFNDVSGDLEKSLVKYKDTKNMDDYNDLFNKADFPLKDKNGAFPESFSYESQGNIYFSIPVPHALGDYAIIKYTPDTK